jgi:arylsulfatase A-like enzyme
MKAVMVMYDSLKRDLMSCFGGPVKTPNFERLQKHTVTFDKSYVGSLPCMPARRELHTGRYNFLHRSWGPVEPFDDSMPEILKKKGIYTYLATDHYHYVEDGGCTYHTRYSGWNVNRGQESDGWVADLTPHAEGFAPNMLSPQTMTGTLRTFRMAGSWQSMHNREKLHSEKDYPMHMTFDDGMDFLNRNGKFDNWFLQIETFDPHEPFVSPESFQNGFLSPDEQASPDWPPYAKVCEDQETIGKMRKKYYSLLTFCDQQLGRVLDKMDEMDLWKDTMLIVNTDHGFVLGEHDWWGKGNMPNYEELVHTPLFIWNPLTGKKDCHCDRLVQTIDLAPTLLEYFGAEIPKDMTGIPLRKVIEDQALTRDYALFGYHGGPVCITDGRYVLMRAVADFTQDAYEYTLMPTHMRNFFTVDEMKTTELHEPFSFTKGMPVMKIKGLVNPRYANAQAEGDDLLFDLLTDPKELKPIENEEVKNRLLKMISRIACENEAPDELYRRYKLEKPEA